MKRTGRLREWWLGALGVLLAFGVCEAVSRAGIVRRSYFPPASEVLARAVELAGDSVFLDGVGATLCAWALGLGLACAIAVPLGLLFGSVPVVDAAVRAIVEFLRPLPSVALIPLVSLLLGSGTETKVALVTYASVWPILFNTVYGLGETDPLAKDTLRAFGFGRLSVLLRVELPGTAPSSPPASASRPPSPSSSPSPRRSSPGSARASVSTSPRQASPPTARGTSSRAWSGPGHSGSSSTGCWCGESASCSRGRRRTGGPG